jgi:hypothetical protein
MRRAGCSDASSRCLHVLALWAVCVPQLETFKQLVLSSGVWGVHVLAWRGLGKAVKHVEVRLEEGKLVRIDEGLYVRKTRDGTIELYEEEQHV